MYRLQGRYGHGKFDYSIEAHFNGMIHMFGVTVVKQEDFEKAVAQNLVQLGSILTDRKRKRNNDDDDGYIEEDSSVPTKAYGIVTDSIQWFFLECVIDQPGSSAKAKFRVSPLKETINYQASSWRKEVGEVLGRVVWLMRKMTSEIPNRDNRFKKRRFDTT
ncbi:hypothetical protein BGZ46_006760 [Entomortierella lignicola]|nr:hypothetical protein BGZ46_006760 [Entomortierella lignicola]